MTAAEPAADAPAARSASASPRGMRSAAVRTRNLSEVVGALHTEGALTRSEIGEATGLTRTSIGVLVQDLVDADLVVETVPPASGRPGRPSSLVEFTATYAVLAIEIEVDFIAAAVVRPGGTVVEQGRLRRRTERASPADTTADIGRIARQVLADAGNPVALGTGVAVAGLVRTNDGTVTLAPNLDWHDAPLAPLIAEELPLGGKVLVDNEANLSARAERRRGAGRNTANMIYVAGGVGVGGGIISDGRPISGRSGFAGEVGHISVNPSGVSCGCGSQGCWETEIGQHRLLERAGLDPQGGPEAVAHLWEQARLDDPATLEAVEETGTWLGIGLATLINIFNPELVVLGGIYEPGFPHLVDTVRTQISLRSMRPMDDVSVVPSQLGHTATLLGAAELALDAVLADPLATIASAGVRAARS